MLYHPDASYICIKYVLISFVKKFFIRLGMPVMTLQEVWTFITGKFVNWLYKNCLRFERVIYILWNKQKLGLIVPTAR